MGKIKGMDFDSKNKKLDTKNKLTVNDNEHNTNDLRNKNEQDRSLIDKVKCRSAPVSPTRHLCSPSNRNCTRTLEECCSDNKPAVASFIYDINLYNDSNHVLIKNEEEFNKSLIRIQKNGTVTLISKKNNDKTNNAVPNQPLKSDLSYNSSASSFASIKLEPLVISEEEKPIKVI